MITSVLGRRVRRLGLGSAVAGVALILAAPNATAWGATFTMTSDNGTYSVWSTYSLTITADLAKPGTATFCSTVDRIGTCYKPIKSTDGVATMPWMPIKQGHYEIEAKYVYDDPSAPNGSYGVRDSAYITVYCPGHQGQSWDCQNRP
ncbi:hypothetical protein ACIA8C_01030 [Nocardia sp. NPDC051321]|uniref:hypothetical protein n=1 Tax=Nocardia sp. NPDC051321 TaxID=3364323 RepID=UPI0037BC6EEF